MEMNSESELILCGSEFGMDQILVDQYALWHTGSATVVLISIFHRTTFNSQY